MKTTQADPWVWSTELDSLLREKHIDGPTRSRLIRKFLEDCQVNIKSATRALFSAVKAYRSGKPTDDDIDLPPPGLIYLAAGGKATEQELPSLSYNDQEDRDCLAELVEQRVRTAERRGQKLSFADAAQAVMKAENAPARMAAAGGKKKTSADYSPDELHELTVKEIARAKANGETLSYFQAARRVMVRLNSAA